MGGERRAPRFGLMEDKRGRSGSVVDGGFTTPTKETQKRGERIVGPRVDDPPYINASLRYLGGPRQTECWGQARKNMIQRAARLGLPSNGACLTPMKILDRRPAISPTIRNKPVRIPPMVGRFPDRADLNRRGTHNNPYHDDRHGVRPFDQGSGLRSGCLGVNDNTKNRGDVSGGDTPALPIGAKHFTTLGDEWKEARTMEGRIYFYNRRTREPRWKLPPGATYIPYPSRPTGHRIFVLKPTCPKGSDADTFPVGACYEKGAQGDRATERFEGDCSAVGSTGMLGGLGRSSSAERRKVMSTEKRTRRGRNGLRFPEKCVTREDGLHSEGKFEQRLGFNPSKIRTTRTGGSLILRGKYTRHAKKDGKTSAGIVIRDDELMSAKEAWTNPTDHPDSSERKMASDQGAVIDEGGEPVNGVVGSFGPEKTQGKHHGWLGRGRRSRAVCTDPVASYGRVQRGAPSSNSDASEGKDEAQAYPQTSDQFAFVPHTASSASPSNNSSSFCCSTSGIKETAVDGRRQRVGLSPQLEATDGGARRCSASRGIPFRRTCLSPGNASAAQATDIIGIGARPADVANGAPGALDSGGRTTSNASPKCGNYPVICTGRNPIDAAVVTTVSAKCEGVTPAWTEAPTTITGADAVEDEFLGDSRCGPWSSSLPSTPLSFAVCPVPHRSFGIRPFPPDEDSVLRCSSTSPQAGQFRQPLGLSCSPPDGIGSWYREDKIFATSAAAARSEVGNPSALADPELPLTPPQNKDLGGKSVGVIVQKISSRRGELGEQTVSGPLEDARVKHATESDSTSKRSSLRIPDRFRNENKYFALGKEVSDPVPDRIGMTESVVGFENGSPCVTVRVEDAEASLTSRVAAAHEIVYSGKSDNSLGAVLEDALQLKSRDIGAFRSSRNESVDADYQGLKAGYSTECSSSSTSFMQNYARCIRVASGGGEASLTSPTPVAAVTSVEGGGRSLLSDRVECMAGATILTVDEPPSPASGGDGKRCHGRSAADARPKAVRNESGINCGTLRNEEDGIASTPPRSVAAKSPGRPLTAITTVLRDGDMSAKESEPATRSTCRSATAQRQGMENRIDVRTWSGGHDGDLEGEGGSPGSSVVRHKVRRKLFSEASEARPMVFCPFCGDGVLASGRLREHLEACYVFARSRGSQTHFEVEAAVRAVSCKGKKPALRARGSCDEDPCEATGTYSAEDKIAFRKASSMREVTSSATIPGDGNKSATDTTLEARGEIRKESFISDDRKTSLAGAKISGDGREMERCGGCRRTFDPGRLHLHAKEPQKRGERMVGPRVDDTAYIETSLRVLEGPRQTACRGQESYFYNRRTGEHRWKLPPGVTHIPDSSRPAGYRIFAHTATCPKGSDADTSPVGACYEKGAQGDHATERFAGDCSAAGSTNMLGGHERSSSAERQKVVSTIKNTRRGRNELRSEKGITRGDGLHSGGKIEQKRGFNPSKTSTTRTRGSVISRGKCTRRAKQDGGISAGILKGDGELMSAKEAWTSPTDNPDSSEKKTASDKGTVIDEREGEPVNRVVESSGLEKSQGKHHGWLGRGRRSRAVCTDPVASYGRVQRGTPSSNSDASEGDDEAQSHPQTSDQFGFVPHTASSASPSNNSSTFCCNTINYGIQETAVDGRCQRVELSPQLEATDGGARWCSASRGIPFRRTSLSSGNANATHDTGIIGIGARPADVGNDAPGALDSGGRTTINAYPTCGDYPVICTGGNPIDAAVGTTVSAKCEGVKPARTEDPTTDPTTITGTDAVKGEFLRDSRSGPWSSSPPSSPLSFALSPVPRRSFSVSPFHPDDDTVLRRSSKSPLAGRFRQPLELSCTPPDGIDSRYREDEIFATSAGAARSEIGNPSAFTDPELPLTPPQDNDVGGRSVEMIVQKLSSRKGKLEKRTVSGPLEDARVKDAAESDTKSKRSSLRTSGRFRNEEIYFAFRKEVSDPVPGRIGTTESVVGFENGLPCVTVRVEDAEASLTSRVVAAHGILDSGKSVNAYPTCGKYPVICTGGNPIDAAVGSTVSAKCKGVTPAQTEDPTTITGTDTVEGEFSRDRRSDPWSSSPPSSPWSFAVSPVPRRSFSITPFHPDDDTVLRCSSESPLAGRFRQPLEFFCIPSDGIGSRYREYEMFATSAGAARSEIGNHSAFTDPESPLIPPQDNDVCGKSVGVIVQNLSSRKGKLEKRTVSGPLEDARVKDAAESDTKSKRSSLRTPDRFRNEKKTIALRKEVSGPVPDRIGTTESVVGFENESPCATVRDEDTEASLTSRVAAAHDILDSGKSDNSLGAVLEDALQLKPRGIGALFCSGRNESADAGYQCLKARYSTECSSSLTSSMQNYARCIRVASGGGDPSLTSPTPVAGVASAEGGGRSLLPDRVECMAGATLSTVDEPSSPASGGYGTHCHGRATADARPKAVRNENGINCGTLRNEEDGIASTLPWSVAAKAPGSPLTAITTVSRDGEMSATESEPATRSTCRSAAAQTQGMENRIDVRTWSGGHDGDPEGEEGLPGSSVVRHKVRRQLFSEASEARPIVFCPFCGDGGLASGRLREHLEACYVFARSRGSQAHFEVEAAVRAVSRNGGKPDLLVKGSCDEDPCEVAGNYSAEDKLAFHSASSMREVTSSANVPGDGNNSATDTMLEARGKNRKEIFISDDHEPSFVPLVQSSLAGAKIYGDGREMGCCEGCGRTFAPGRLHSHTKELETRCIQLESKDAQYRAAIRKKGVDYVRLPGDIRRAITRDPCASGGGAAASGRLYSRGMESNFELSPKEATMEDGQTTPGVVHSDQTHRKAEDLKKENTDLRSMLLKSKGAGIKQYHERHTDLVSAGRNINGGVCGGGVDPNTLPPEISKGMPVDWLKRHLGEENSWQILGMRGAVMHVSEGSEESVDADADVELLSKMDVARLVSQLREAKSLLREQDAIMLAAIFDKPGTDFSGGGDPQRCVCGTGGDSMGMSSLWDTREQLDQERQELARERAKLENDKAKFLEEAVRRDMKNFVYQSPVATTSSPEDGRGAATQARAQAQAGDTSLSSPAFLRQRVNSSSPSWADSPSCSSRGDAKDFTCLTFTPPLASPDTARLLEKIGI